MNKQKQKRISQSFQSWLLILVIVAFLATTAFLWIFQTKLSEDNAINLLELNIRDVEADISDASDVNLLELTHRVAEELKDAPQITSELLAELAEKHYVSELNYIDEQGIIRASTYPDFLNFDMSSGDQSAEFLVLLEGTEEYVQPYGPVSYDASISRKYGGVTLEQGGFIQAGYNANRFQNALSSAVKGVAKNRHIGEGGGMIVTSQHGRSIVSDRRGNEGLNLASTGLALNLNQIPAGETFEAEVYGIPSYCMYRESEGYLIIAMIPKSEAALSRNVAVIVTTVMQIIVFTALFLMIYVLVKRLVVDNIHKINHSLEEITEGKLETVVNVRSHEEFDKLSDDINQTVGTLKKYIADAAARIDTELAFAKAIQHSALPSVFPPFPGRKEIDLHAAMFTAKEVGGDFYDFYFVDKDTLAFLVADVSGKGIPAAMFMMQSKTLLKSLAESGMSIEQVFTVANEKLCEGNEAGMFVTAWMGLLNVKTGLVTFANAGHNPPIVGSGGSEFEHRKTRPGFVLAGMEGMRYRKFEMQLQPGDTVYLYTDGVTEAVDGGENLYGEQRLLQLLNSHRGAGAEEICQAVKTDVDLFAGEVEQFDDITMLCLTWHGPQEMEAQT